MELLCAIELPQAMEHSKDSTREKVTLYLLLSPAVYQTLVLSVNIVIILHKYFSGIICFVIQSIRSSCVPYNVYQYVIIAVREL